MTGRDNQTLSLYAKGMTTCEITSPFKALYGTAVFTARSSKVTDAVMEPIVEWQNSPLYHLSHGLPGVHHAENLSV
ncbi:transposase [Klebsiella aerogenes]|uniref:transposase n=1 Tax=Klebsiella aerogenes TaxID=548 RepID=UPI00387EE194